MLGLDGVVDVAHRAEDLLGALKDGRLDRPQGPGRRAARVGREHQPVAAGCRAPGRRRRARRRRGGAGLAPWPATTRSTVPAPGQPRTSWSTATTSRGRGARLDPRPHPAGARPARRRRRGRARRAPGRPARPGAGDAGRRPRRGPPAPCASRWPAADVDPRLLDALHELVALGDQLGAAARELLGPRRGRPGAGSPTSATAPWAWRWCRCAGWSPASRSSSASWPRRGRRRPGKDVRAGAHRPGRRAGHAGARRGRRRAAPPGHQRRRPRLRVAGRADPGRQAAAGDGHGLGPRRRVHGRDRGLRRRAGRRRGQPCARSPSPAACCRPTRPLTGAALLQVLFSPGFSTRDEVTQTSGRGVGLDVVRTVVEDLSGTIEVRAEPGARHHLHHQPARDARRAALPDGPGGHRALRPARRPAWSRRSGWPTAERHEVAGVPVLARDGRTMPLVDLGRRPRRARRPRAAGRRRGPARRRRRAAGPRRRRARGRARGRGQGARHLPRPAADGRRGHHRR